MALDDRLPGVTQRRHRGSRDRLPPPDAAARTHGARLLDHIRERIAAAGGAIPFVEYMELALYAPGLGYYGAGSEKLGPGGDFVTAPELSPLFGRCVARQCQQVLIALGGGDVLEMGAGSGALAVEVLAHLDACDLLPNCYAILETSADLQSRQRATLRARLPHLLARVRWLTELPGAGWKGVVLANEVADAMPVHRFCVTEQGLREYYVTLTGEELGWRLGTLSDPRLDEVLAQVARRCGHPLAPGYTSEVNLRAGAWLGAVAETLLEGLILVIDYGFPRCEYYHPQRSQGTLMCHYRHRAHDDPLILTGLQDITAHVDFTALAEAALEVGLDVAGYTTQAHFLLAAGLQDILADSDPSDSRAHQRLVQQVRTLTLPQEMGELFKVIAFARELALTPLGFALRDMRDRL